MVMAQVASIKPEELKEISRILLQRKADVIKIYHYPEFHLFIAFDPVLEKDLHVMDINTVGPMIDYYLGDGYRITNVTKREEKGLFDSIKEEADEKPIENEELRKATKLLSDIKERQTLEQMMLETIKPVDQITMSDVRESEHVLHSVFANEKVKGLSFTFIDGDGFPQTRYFTRNVKHENWTMGNEVFNYKARTIVDYLLHVMTEKQIIDYNITKFEGEGEI